MEQPVGVWETVAAMRSQEPPGWIPELTIISQVSLVGTPQHRLLKWIHASRHLVSEMRTQPQDDTPSGQGASRVPGCNPRVRENPSRWPAARGGRSRAQRARLVPCGPRSGPIPILCGCYTLLAVVACLVLSSCGRSVSGRESLAKSKAEEVFRSFSVSSNVNDAAWGLTRIRVFGRDRLFGRMGAGNTEVVTRADSPDTYEVLIPFWCRGVTAHGDSVRRKGAFSALISIAGGKPAVQKGELQPFEPLSSWRQFFAYGGWGLLFGASLALVSRFFGLFAGHTPVFLAGLACVPLAGYIASVEFGSLLAITVCVCLNVGAFVVVETLQARAIEMQEDIAKAIRLGMLLGPFGIMRAKRREREHAANCRKLGLPLEWCTPAYDARGLRIGSTLSILLWSAIILALLIEVVL